MADPFDVVIIGGGPAGYNAAIRAGQLGLRAVCVEGMPKLGGTCLNVGCMPAKSLLHASEQFEAARNRFGGLGIRVEPRLDLPQMMAQKEEAVAKLTKGVEFLFRKSRVEWLRGWGRIDGPGRVRVRMPDGGETVLETRNIVVATGSSPSELAGVAVDCTNVVTSTEAMTFNRVPESLVVIGAGVIGLELGSVWRRLGARVTVLEYLDRVLPGIDGEIATLFQRTMRKQGINFRLGVAVRSTELASGSVEVSFEPAGGGPMERISAEKVLVAVGRRPFTEGLGLDSVGIEPDARGMVSHDGSFRTAAQGVWVIGDVTSGPMLAHKAEEEAIACVETIAGLHGMVEPELIPSVVYTTPEVAGVGATEEALKAEGIEYRVGRFQFMANSRARIYHETEGMVKVLADARSDTILGAHILGPQAGELISEYCLAMAFGSTAEDVARVCHPHPTRSEALRQATMDVSGWAMQA
jgi:dihydrolipoamide dehydrogenase